MFLQISNSSAILIFNARTQGFSFMSVPAIQLFMSAVVSQLFVNCMLLFAGGFIVEQMEPIDVATIWAYDLSWLIIIDLVKMTIIRIQDGGAQEQSLTQAMNRQSFMRASRAGKSSSKSSSTKLGSDVRISISGQPMVPKGTSDGLI